jgi:hypothetical protein
VVVADAATLPIKGRIGSVKLLTAAIVAVGGVVPYPLPGLVIRIPVTTPLVKKAWAVAVTPLVGALRVMIGGTVYPLPPAVIGIVATLPLESVIVPTVKPVPGSVPKKVSAETIANPAGKFKTSPL